MSLYKFDDKTQIDEYGVNHSDFSLRDEIEYNAHRAKEKEMRQSLNPNGYKQGIVDKAVNFLATPTVKRAYALSKEYSQPKYNNISDVDKHRYISCISASGGPISAVETIIGSGLKETKDIWNKLSNDSVKQKYGGTWGVFKDSFKDMKNNIIGSSTGGASGVNMLPDDYCDVVFGQEFRNK